MNQMAKSTTTLPSIEESASQLKAVLRQYAESLAALKDEELGPAVQFASSLGKLSEEVYDRLVERGLLYLNVHGESVGDKGTKRAEIGEYEVSAIPTRTGIDPRKLESALRAMGIPVEAAMVPTTSWAIDQNKLAALHINHPKFTQAILDNCKYDKSYRLQVKRRQ